MPEKGIRSCYIRWLWATVCLLESELRTWKAASTLNCAAISPAPYSSYISHLLRTASWLTGKHLAVRLWQWAWRVNCTARVLHSVLENCNSTVQTVLSPRRKAAKAVAHELVLCHLVLKATLEAVDRNQLFTCCKIHCATDGLEYPVSSFSFYANINDDGWLWLQVET